MNAFFEFLKWLIKVSLAASALIIVAAAALVFGFVSKRRARKEASDD